jgi:hypothetical protein
MTRSPKGLIKNTSLIPEEIAQLMPDEEEELIASRSVTPEEMEQLDSGVFQLRGPDEKIKNSIAFWKWFAGLHVEAKPATNGTLDRTAAAKGMLATLQRIEHTHAAAKRNAASGDLYELAICYCLSFADEVHQLAIIDNKTPIVAWRKSVRGAAKGGKRRSARKRIRNREMAKEFKDSPGGRMSDTARMVKIGAARKLKRTASINAIKAGRRYLNRGD